MGFGSLDPSCARYSAALFDITAGDRVTVMVIPNASHAAIAEQPTFIADELIKYARGLAAAAPAGSP